MSGDPANSLDYGRETPTPPSMRWLILLLTWAIGLVIWVLYFLVIGALLFKILV